MSRRDRDRLRRSGIGFVRGRTAATARTGRVLDHVALPLLSDGVTVRQARRTAAETLARVGAAEYTYADLHHLSESEQLRVALAQAYVRSPRLLVVDELTDTLDLEERNTILGILQRFAQDDDVGIIVTASDPNGTAGCNRVVYLSAGRLRDPERDLAQAPGAPDGRRGAFPSRRHRDGLVPCWSWRTSSNTSRPAERSSARSTASSLTVEPGQLVALYGPSGAGKTTLLLLAGAMAAPDAGNVRFDGARPRAPVRCRGDAVPPLDAGVRGGRSSTSTRLCPRSTTRASSCWPRAPTRRQARAAAAPWLDRVGLSDRAEHPPESSRPASGSASRSPARWSTAPRLVLADEPTGNLDTRRASSILQLLADVSHNEGVGVLLVTHDPAAASYADRVHTLSDGKLVSHEPDADRTRKRGRRTGRTTEDLERASDRRSVALLAAAAQVAGAGAAGAFRDRGRRRAGLRRPGRQLQRHRLGQTDDRRHHRHLRVRARSAATRAASRKATISQITAEPAVGAAAPIILARAALSGPGGRASVANSRA